MTTEPRLRFPLGAILLAPLLFLAGGPAAAQEYDLEAARPTPEPGVNSVLASVVPSTTPIGDGVLQFRITHRFSQAINDSTSNDLFGFDSAADIGLGVEWGFSPNLDAGIYRSSFEKDWQGHLRFRWIAQCDAFPVSISTKVGGNYLADPTITKDRSGAFVQVVVQRTAGPLTMIAAPSWVSNTPSYTNAWNVPFGFVLRAGESWSVLAECVPKNPDNRDGKTAWLVALEKRLPGHTFAITFGNSRATTIDMAMASDFPGGFEPMDVRIGFHITRRWRW